MLAIVAMIATSCQQEVDLGVNAGETATVTFNVGTPTRAYSDGATAKVLQYAVYNAAGEELTDLTKSLANENAETINMSTTVNLQLVTGNTYAVIFWAAAPNAPYAVNFAEQTMTVNYEGAVSNDENRDAFYKYHTFTVTGAQTETIELKRPFAQLNIGTNDYAAAASAGYTPETSWVVVKNIYNTLDLNSGAVSNPVEVTFAENAIPTTETFPVGGHEYLAMNYLLVNEQVNIEVEFSYKDADAANADEITKSRTVGSVPVQRNHRTNLYGSILTSDVTINVEIKPAYEEPAYGSENVITLVYNAEELQAAIDAAVPSASRANNPFVNVITFGADIVGNVTVAQKEGINIQLNGAGHKYDGTILVDGNSRGPVAETLTLSNIAFETANSDVTFISSPSKINGHYSYSHNVTVDGCTFKGNNTVGCVSLTGTYNAVVRNCTATDVHSLAQFQSVDNKVLVENVTINGKNGISFGNTAYPTLKNATIVATGYGVRGDGDQNRGALVIENSNITAAQPIVVRKVTTNYSLTLGEGVELNRTAGIHDVIFTNGQDDAAYVAPTGTYTFTSVANYNVFPVIAYTDATEVSAGLFYSASAKTYLVASTEGLVAASNTKVKGRETIALVADIDLAGVAFNGLSAFNPGDDNVFDGNGHTVSNWTNESGASDMGFIREWVGPVKNVTIKNATLKTSGRSAIVAAKIYGNIENCHVVDCEIVDTYWACGLIAGLYNAGKIQNCTVTGSYVESNGGTGGIVGVINEEAGKRGVNYCSVSNTTVNNKGSYGEAYSGGLICGMINVSNATIEFKGNTYENNTKLGKYVGDLYYNADDNTIVTE